MFKLRSTRPFLASSGSAPLSPRACQPADSGTMSACTRRAAVTSMLLPLLLPGTRAFASTAPTPLRSGYQKLLAPAGSDLIVTMPTPRTGGLQVVGEGGRFVVPDGRNAGSGSFSLNGHFSAIELHGVHLNLPRDRIADGIGLWGSSPKVTIRNTRITGVHGQQQLRHGDGIQAGDQSEIDTMLVENTTIYSAYQGIITYRSPNGKGLKTLILRNVNIRDEPELRTQLSIALFLGDKPNTGPKTAPYTIVFDNVWVDWPSRSHATHLPDGANVVGKINFGVPPGGDFCPA